MHEIIHLVWTNLNDLFGVAPCMTFFEKLIKSMSEKVKAKEAKGK